MPNQNSIENSQSNQMLPELPFELTFDSVDSWLRRIPIRNTKESSQSVFSALRRLNRYRMNPIQRIGILERFTPYVFGLSDDLERFFIDTTFPLDVNVRRISRLSSQLHAQLAAGYLHVFDRSDFDNVEIADQEKALVLARALHSIYWNLIRTAQIYEAPSTRFWKRLYAVFRYAEHHGLLYREVPGHNRQTQLTAENLFKRITLLWLANPYRHRQHQIKQIVLLLDEFAGLSELCDQRPNNAAESQFFVDLATDAPPRHVSYFAQEEAKACRFLHASPLVEEIIQCVEDPFSELRRIEPAPDRELVVRLAKTLAGAQPRKHPRNSENMAVRFIMGLPDIIEALSQSESEEVGSDRRNPQRSSNIPDYELLPMDAKHVRASPRLKTREEGRGNQVTAEEIWGNKAQAQQRLNASFCSTGHVMNSSIKGYQLMTADNSSIKVKVGEMIAIEQGRQPLHLGVVRWLEAAAGQGVDFGIELLSREADCAWAKFSVTTVLKERVLFLEQLPELDSPKSIVLSHAKYRGGTRVEMAIDGRTHHFRLQKLIELSPGFVRYTLSVPLAQ